MKVRGRGKERREGDIGNPPLAHITNNADTNLGSWLVACAFFVGFLTFRTSTRQVFSKHLHLGSSEGENL